MLLTIQSAGDILDLFRAETPEWGVTEVASELGISKSKAHALLSSLASVGLLRRTERGRYRLGWRVLSLHRVLARTTAFSAYARPVMRALSSRTGEVVHLAALDDGRIVYVDRAEGERAVGIPVSAIGSVLPAHCSGVGKALLAELPPEQLDDVIDCRGLPPMTSQTITNAHALREELAEVRRNGFALDREEAVPEVSCIATPIFDVGQRVVGAISIAAPTDRFRKNESAYRRVILGASNHVSKRLRRTGAPGCEPTGIGPSSSRGRRVSRVPSR